MKAIFMPIEHIFFISVLFLDLSIFHLASPYTTQQAQSTREPNRNGETSVRVRRSTDRLNRLGRSVATISPRQTCLVPTWNWGESAGQRGHHTRAVTLAGTVLSDMVDCDKILLSTEYLTANTVLLKYAVTPVYSVNINRSVVLRRLQVVRHRLLHHPNSTLLLLLRSTHHPPTLRLSSFLSLFFPFFLSCFLQPLSLSSFFPPPPSPLD